MRKRKPAPSFIPLQEITPFVERENELDKESLITRIAGHVRRETLQLIKMIQFRTVYRDAEDHLFLS